MKRNPRWVGVDVALAIHEAQAARFGGAEGLRDRNALESALARPGKIRHYEPNTGLPRLAAAYAHGITQNHPFVDGNKRTAFLVAAVFLDKNGIFLEAPESEVAAIMLELAAGTVSEAGFENWLERHLK